MIPLFDTPFERDDKPVLVVMMGLPRSGKSTLARKLGFPIVCPDAIRLAMHGQRMRKESEPLVWAHAHLMVDSLFLAGHRVVTLDACNLTVKHRGEWNRDDAHLVYLHVITPAMTCIARAKRDGDDEILPVIERMAYAFEPVSIACDIRTVMMINEDEFARVQEFLAPKCANEVV